LREHASSPRDTVMLEPLGYIGYFSGLRMQDYPGLASREVVEIRKRLGPSAEGNVFVEMKPDWFVLRPWEALRLKDLLVMSYDRAGVFDATEKVRATRWLPGRRYLEFDQKFLVFRRKPHVDAAPAD
jgi:hypothetical protein